MTNILEAICNIVSFPENKLKSFYSSRNRANSMGDALENYIKDSFANTFQIETETERIRIFNQMFSWLGVQNNPPDIMIKGGDAIEVKKIQNAGNNLPLNSSYPKADIHSKSPMITKECKECENWTTKDLIYCVGHATDTELKSLWLVYGSIYAAKHETYQRVKNSISNGIKTIPNVVFSETKELGRVNRIDPLGITDLRIRGMWQIKNPRKVFDYLHRTGKNKFEVIAIIPLAKYNSFPDESKERFEAIEDENFSIENVEVKDPNNPAKLINCKLIKYLK